MSFQINALPNSLFSELFALSDAEPLWNESVVLPSRTAGAI